MLLQIWKLESNISIYADTLICKGVICSSCRLVLSFGGTRNGCVVFEGEVGRANGWIAKYLMLSSSAVYETYAQLIHKEKGQ